MKRVKLPSGRIIDIDAISSIRPPASYNTGRSCAFIVDGHSTEVCNGDADALYTAVLATVEPIRLTDADEHGNVEGRYTDDDAPGDDMIATHREMKRRMAVIHSM